MQRFDRQGSVRYESGRRKMADMDKVVRDQANSKYGSGRQRTGRYGSGREEYQAVRD